MIEINHDASPQNSNDGSTAMTLNACFKKIAVWAASAFVAAVIFLSTEGAAHLVQRSLISEPSNPAVLLGVGSGDVRVAVIVNHAGCNIDSVAIIGDDVYILVFEEHRGFVGRGRFRCHSLGFESGTFALTPIEGSNAMKFVLQFDSGKRLEAPIVLGR